MSQARAKKQTHKKQSKALDAFVCGRCGGHFIILGEFVDHVQARTCSKLALLMNSIENQLVAMISQVEPVPARKKARGR